MENHLALSNIKKSKKWKKISWAPLATLSPCSTFFSHRSRLSLAAHLSHSLFYIPSLNRCSPSSAHSLLQREWGRSWRSRLGTENGTKEVPRREVGVVGDEEAALKTSRSIFIVGRGSTSGQLSEVKASASRLELDRQCLVVRHTGVRMRPTIRARGSGGARSERATHQGRLVAGDAGGSGGRAGIVGGRGGVGDEGAPAADVEEKK
jgi:hypothetical protein